MTTTNEATYYGAWNSILHCERLVRYFEMSRSVSERWAHGIRMATSIGLIGAGVSFAVMEPEWWSIMGSVLACLGAVASIFGLAGQYAERAVTARISSRMYDQLNKEWKRVFTETRESRDVEAQVVILERLLAMIDTVADDVGRADDKRNKRAAEDAYSIVGHEFEYMYHEATKEGAESK